MEVVMKKIKIILTCVGSQVSPSIIELIREHPLYDVHIIGIDNKSKKDCISIKFLNQYYQVPLGNDKRYIPTIKEIVKKNSVKLIFPGSDEEVLSLSAHKEEFRKNYNCEICCASKNVVKVAVNKYKLMIELKENGIDVAEVYALNNLDDLHKYAKKLGYPKKKFIIKPQFGRGSAGFRVVTDNYDKYKSFYFRDIINISLEELEGLFSEKSGEISNYLLMEYLPGNKYSSDVLVENGNVISMVTRNNWKMPKVRPPTQLADIVFDEDIREYVNRIIKCMGFDYFIQVETGRNHYGKPMLIETNTRLDAALPITMGVGINFYHELITYAIEGKFRDNLPDYKSYHKGIRFIRYWTHYFKEI